jgi:cell division protein FtsI (penicillin-binding protein 3)
LNASENNKYRELTLWIVIFSILLALLIKLIFFQKNDFSLGKEFSKKASIRQSSIASKRGVILDRNNYILAEDIPSYEIGISLKDFSFDPIHINLISTNLDLDIDRLKKRLARKKTKHLVLNQKVAKEKKEHIQSLEIPGIVISNRTFKRNYPQGEIFSQLIGLTNYKNEGVNGIEFALEETLKAEDGYQEKILSRKSGVIQNTIIKQPINGSAVNLTVDSKMQFILFEKLKKAVEFHNAESASGIMIDLDSNEILAMTNFPSFDPNNRKKLNNMELLKNNSAIELFEPGSTVKPLALSALLKNNPELIESAINTSPGWIEFEGYKTEDARNYGMLSTEEIIAKSSNVGMVKLCADFDPNQILRTYYSLGLGKYMNEIFISTREGYLPEYKNLSLREKVSLCYGYGLQTTLVQLTSAYSTIFSEGIYRPLKLIKNSSQFEEERILSKENAKQIKKILYKAIKNGTGFRAIVKDHDVFGKTGTARIFKNRKYNDDLHNALFIGMTEIEDKEYLVGLFVKSPKINGEGGGDVAAPIFSEIIETIQKL